MTNTAEIIEPREGHREVLESVVVRFAGDSGDGMQLTGSQFTQSTALAGNDLATFPDFPAEIRAPTGTTFGVSAFQINFGARRVMTAGDQPDVLVAMNSAALKVNIGNLRRGGLIILDSGTFKERDLRKAGYDANPLEDGTLDPYQVVEIDVSKMVVESVKEFGLGTRDALRCKNMWLLGLVYWLYGRDRQPSIDWLNNKFKSKPEVAAANVAALNAGHAYGETVELPGEILGYTVGPAKIDSGLYRNVAGAEALAWGLAAGTQLAELPMFFGSYPIIAAAYAGTTEAVRHHDIPGRGRDRGGLCRHRCILCRSDRRHLQFRTGHRPEDGGHRPRHHGGVAAGDRELAARRPLDRHADQDPAVGSPSIGLRAQRRQPAGGAGGERSRRLFLHRDRGGAAGHEVHDPGDAADGRLYRQCFGAMDDPGLLQLREVPGEAAYGNGGFRALQP